VTPAAGSKLKLTASPAARTTVPASAMISPALRTSGARSATYPPSALRIVPSLKTTPVAPARRKFRRPARKSASEIESVEATKEPTSTLEVGPK
jgi:hypothetical protein